MRCWPKRSNSKLEILTKYELRRTILTKYIFNDDDKVLIAYDRFFFREFYFYIKRCVYCLDLQYFAQSILWRFFN